MADEEGRVFVLSKKAFVTTLVAIALNPIGAVLGYGVGKWLQAPKLTVQTSNIDAETEGVTLPKDLVPILDNMQRAGIITTYRFRPEETDRLKNGALSVAVARSVIADAQTYKGWMASLKRDLEYNITATTGWVRGQELIVRPLYLTTGSITGEAPQTIADRNKNELLGIYRSSLKDVEEKLADSEHLLDYLEAHPTSDKRTGETTIEVGVLNSGDSEGVIYPKALLRSAAGEIDLTSTGGSQNFGAIGTGNSGGYVVVPPRSFRQVTFVMDRSTRGDAAENWKRLVQWGIRSKANAIPV